MIKSLKLSLLLFSAYVCFVPVSYAGVNKEKCLSVIDEIEAILRSVDDWSKYEGQAGYVKLTSELGGTRSMNYVFQTVSRFLGKKKISELGWQAFQGTVTEFKELRGKILNPDGTIREEYQGMEGYAKFAEQYYEANMLIAYKNVSAVLDKPQMQMLAWQAFQGKVPEFKELRGKILNPDGTIREEYQGMKGYAKFAEQYYEANMQKTYQNVSAVLDKPQMQMLAWQAFQGTVTEFNELRDKILNPDGTIREEYQGMEGYAKFAEQYYEANMLIAYKNVSAVLDKPQMQMLAWQAFQGKVPEFKELRGKILNPDGTIREEYQGMEGYAKFAELYYVGDMKKAYQNVSAVLDKPQMQMLAWQVFQGKVPEFNELRDKILNPDGTIREEYQGMEGYAKFAEQYYEANMPKAYQNVSAVLGGVLSMRELGLGWKQFQGRVSQFENLKQLFRSTDRRELEGEKGQKKVADTIFNGNRSRAYGMVSILKEELVGGKKAFEELNWRR